MMEEVNEFDFENRILSNEYNSSEDSEVENCLRPKTLSEYVGQEKAKSNLKVYIESAKIRGEALDHVLLYGPPGLGKTTLSAIIANEMGVNIRTTSGPAIEKANFILREINNEKATQTNCNNSGRNRSFGARLVGHFAHSKRK